MNEKLASIYQAEPQTDLFRDRIELTPEPVLVKNRSQQGDREGPHRAAARPGAGGVLALPLGGAGWGGGAHGTS